MRFQPRLRTILLAVNLAVLLLPVAGVFVLRLYDNQLIRRTEEKLIVQAALVEAMYREELLAEVPSLEGYGHPLPVQQLLEVEPPEPFRPVEARLDLASDPVLPPASDPRPASSEAHPGAIRAGEMLSRAMRRAQVLTLVGYRVVDPEGVVVASSRGELGMSLAHRQEVVRALGGELVSLMRVRISDDPRPPLEAISRSGKTRVFVAVPVTEGYRVLGAVVVSRTPLTALESLHGYRYQLAAAAAGLLAVVFAVSLLTALNISRPVQALIRQAESLSRGDREGASPIAYPGTREIAQLSESFVRMSDAVSERATYIRDFAAAVSHEFKTPLTSIQGSIELLRDHGDEMSREERERFLANMEKDSDRMSRQVRKLLDLARADMLEPGNEQTALDGFLEALVGRYRAEGLDVTYRRSGATVSMAAEVLETVLSNLLDNARQHGGEQVKVEIAVSALSDRTVLTVADDGPGVGGGDGERIFDAFFTTDRAHGGTGLGLTVVRSLLRAHRGRIEIEESEVGSRFRIEIPVRRA